MMSSNSLYYFRGSETIKLEKGKWYRVETGKDLTMSIVNVRIE